MLLHSKADKSASNSSCCFLSPVVHLWRGGASHHVLRPFLVALQSSSRSLALCAAFCTDDCLFIHAVFWAMLYCGLCGTLRAPQWLGLSGFWRCLFGQCALSRMNLGALPRAVRYGVLFTGCCVAGLIMLTTSSFRFLVALVVQATACALVFSKGISVGF